MSVRRKKNYWLLRGPHRARRMFSIWKYFLLTCFDERNSFHSFEVFLWCELIKTLTLTCFLSMTRDPFWCSSFLFITGYLSVIFLHFHIPFFIFWFLLHMFFRSSLFLPMRRLGQRKFQLFFLTLSFMNFWLRFLCLPVCVHLHSHSKAVKILGIFFLSARFDRNSSTDSVLFD